jgi:hypothetical protein
MVATDSMCLIISVTQFRALIRGGHCFSLIRGK